MTSEVSDASKSFVGAIVETYDVALRKFLARRLLDPSEVEEVAQEVYLRLHRYEHQSEIENAEAFLFTIAGNLLRDRRRQQISKLLDQHVTIDSVQIEAPTASPERILQSKQEINILVHALKQLKPNCRRAFVLSRFGGMNYKQIAQEMGISVAMVEHHMMRALSQLRKKLKESR